MSINCFIAPDKTLKKNRFFTGKDYIVRIVYKYSKCIIFILSSFSEIKLLAPSTEGCYINLHLLHYF